MEKKILNRRLSLMEQEGVYFRTNVNVGVDLTFDQMKAEYNAVVLAGGAGLPRDLPVPGRELKGVHFAMEYLTLSNKRVEGDPIADADFISAKGKRVVIIGGGDTGADCLGTVHRQGALSVHQFELLPRPPDARTADNPWPLWPNVFRVSTAHEEGGDRVYSVATHRFSGDEQGRVKTLHGSKVELVLKDGRMSFENLPERNSRWRPIWCCWRWDFSVPSTRGCSIISASG